MQTYPQYYPQMNNYGQQYNLQQPYMDRLTSENKRRAKKKVRSMLRLLKEGKITEKEFKKKYGAWKNHASHGNTVKLIHSMDLHIKSEIEKGKVI